LSRACPTSAVARDATDQIDLAYVAAVFERFGLLDRLD
jgi:hypothetical protein